MALRIDEDDAMNTRPKWTILFLTLLVVALVGGAGGRPLALRTVAQDELSPVATLVVAPTETPSATPSPTGCAYW